MNGHQKDMFDTSIPIPAEPLARPIDNARTLLAQTR
jgi:hypothetical protein